MIDWAAFGLRPSGSTFGVRRTTAQKKKAAKDTGFNPFSTKLGRSPQVPTGRPPDAVLKKLERDARQLKKLKEKERTRREQLCSVHPNLAQWRDALQAEEDQATVSRLGSLDFGPVDALDQLGIAELPEEARWEAFFIFRDFLNVVRKRCGFEDDWWPAPPWKKDGSVNDKCDFWIVRDALGLH